MKYRGSALLLTVTVTLILCQISHMLPAKGRSHGPPLHPMAVAYNVVQDVVINITIKKNGICLTLTGI